MFSSGSQHVPQICNVSPKMFSIAPLFFSLAMVQFSCIYLVKVGAKGMHNKACFYSGEGSFFRFYVGKCLMLQKIGDEAMGLIDAHNSCPTISFRTKMVPNKVRFPNSRQPMR